MIAVNAGNDLRLAQHASDSGLAINEHHNLCSSHAEYFGHAELSCHCLHRGQMLGAFVRDAGCSFNNNNLGSINSKGDSQNQY